MCDVLHLDIKAFDHARKSSPSSNSSLSSITKSDLNSPISITLPVTTNNCHVCIGCQIETKMHNLCSRKLERTCQISPKHLMHNTNNHISNIPDIKIDLPFKIKMTTDQTNTIVLEYPQNNENTPLQTYSTYKPSIHVFGIILTDKEFQRTRDFMYELFKDADEIATGNYEIDKIYIVKYCYYELSEIKVPHENISMLDYMRVKTRLDMFAKHVTEYVRVMKLKFIEAIRYRNLQYFRVLNLCDIDFNLVSKLETIYIKNTTYPTMYVVDDITFELTIYLNDKYFTVTGPTEEEKNKFKKLIGKM